VLIVAIWREHQDHRAVERWFRGIKMADLVRLANAGFLRIAAATHFRFAPNHNSAKRLFRNSCARMVVDFISDDFSPKENRRRLEQTIYRLISCRIGRETRNEIGNS
jgi:hypothetical protein